MPTRIVPEYFCIPEAMVEDYGYDHPNTLRVKKYFEVYNKDCQYHFSKSNQILK